MAGKDGYVKGLSNIILLLFIVKHGVDIALTEYPRHVFKIR